MSASTTSCFPGVEVFTASGWTIEQWTALHEFFAFGEGERGASRMASWLRDPRRGVGASAPLTLISPTMVMDVFARYGIRAAQILAAMSVGASERFAVAFLEYDPLAWGDPSHSPIVSAWLCATAELGLSEPDATGWAATEHLHTPRNTLTGPLLPDENRTVVIRAWVRLCGPGAYLWPLAGFTLAEAADLREAGRAITGQQLRVMAALNGVTLPAGV